VKTMGALSVSILTTQEFVWLLNYDTREVVANSLEEAAAAAAAARHDPGLGKKVNLYRHGQRSDHGEDGDGNRNSRPGVHKPWSPW
jgi:hypothetical protein